MSHNPEMFTTEKTAKVVVVTPELAENWLQHNHQNRALSVSNLDRLATAVQGNEYVFNGDTICWGTNGQMLDGQHRCTTIVTTGKALETVVVWGVDPAAQITMDRGKRRTLIDHLRIKGEQGSKELATVLNLACDWGTGTRFSIGMHVTRPSFEQAYAYLLDNPNVRLSVATATHLKGVRKVINPAHLAFLHWVFSNIDAYDADDFITRLVTGEHDDDNEGTWRLREKLVAIRAEGLDKPHVVIPLACKAWNFYRQGTPVKSLRLRLGGSTPEAFPEPK